MKSYFLLTLSVLLVWSDFLLVKADETDDPTIDSSIYTEIDSTTDTLCSKYGPKCDDECQLLGRCIYDATNENYTWIQVENCTETLSKCDEVSNSCSNSSTCISKDEEYIECGVEGHTYPSPYNCSEYYVCEIKGVLNTAKSCTKEGLAFNACTGNCSNVILDSVCPTEEKFCSYVGEDRVIADNNAMYYNCIRNPETFYIYPSMQHCKEDSHYDTNSHSCVPNENNLICNGKTVTCTTSGNKFDPENCRGYYICSNGLKPTHFNCKSGQFYNKTTHYCQNDNGSCKDN